MKQRPFICLITILFIFSLFSACSDGDKIKGDKSEKIISDGVVRESGGNVFLANDDLQVEIGENGVIKGITTSDSREVLRGDCLQAKIYYSTSKSMWEARSWKVKQAKTGKVEKTKNSVTVEYSDFENVKAVVRTQICLSKDNIYFYTTLENKDSGTIVAVEAPYFTGLKVLENDSLRLPDRNGVKIDYPFTTNNTSEERSMRYPVNMSFQMMTYGNDEASVAIRCEDKEMSYKELQFGGENNAFSIRQYPFAERGDKCSLPATVLKCAQEDWHAASIDYAKWWSSFAEKPVWVDNLKDFPTTTATESAHWNTISGAESASIDELVAATQEDNRAGYDATQVQAWWNPTGSEGSYDYVENTKWPEYEYSSKMADKYGLAEFAERVQQTGIQVGLFQNARLSSEDSRYCKDEWKVKPSLSEKYATTETWFGKTHYVMCPTTEYFEVLYNRQAEFAWAGINFMQLDQIGAAPSFLCFGKNHGHSSPATAWKEGYLDGYLKNMSGLSEQYGIWYWTEGVWEGASQYVQVSHRAKMYGSEEPSEDCPEYYEFTFPGYRLWGDAWSGGVPVWNYAPGSDGVKILKGNSDFYLDSIYRDTYGLSNNCNDARCVWNYNQKLNEVIILGQGNTSGNQLTATIKLDKAMIGNASLDSYTTVGYSNGVIVKENDSEIVLTIRLNGNRMGGARIKLIVM